MKLASSGRPYCPDIVGSQSGNAVELIVGAAGALALLDVVHALPSQCWIRVCVGQFSLA